MRIRPQLEYHEQYRTCCRIFASTKYNVCKNVVKGYLPFPRKKTRLISAVSTTVLKERIDVQIFFFTAPIIISRRVKNSMEKENQKASFVGTRQRSTSFPCPICLMSVYLTVIGVFLLSENKVTLLWMKECLYQPRDERSHAHGGLGALDVDPARVHGAVLFSEPVVDLLLPADVVDEALP